MSCNHFTPTFLQSVKVAKHYGAKLWKVLALMLGSPVDPDWQTVIYAPLEGWHQEPPSSVPLPWVSFRQERDDTRNVRRSHSSSFETLEMPPSVLLLPVYRQGQPAARLLVGTCWNKIPSSIFCWLMSSEKTLWHKNVPNCLQFLYPPHPRTYESPLCFLWALFNGWY